MTQYAPLYCQEYRIQSSGIVIHKIAVFGIYVSVYTNRWSGWFESADILVLSVSPVMSRTQILPPTYVLMP